MSSGYTAPEEAVAPWNGSEADSWEFVDAEAGEVSPAGTVQLPIPVRVRWTAEDFKREQIVPFLPIGVAERYRLLACSDLPGLGEFSFPALADLYYDPELLSTPVLPDLRIARAVRAGISAAQKLSGERAATVASVKLSGCCSNRWYICLRGPNHPTGFVTSFYGVYHRNIVTAGTSKFHPSGVSHAFPSLAEVTAFLAAARAQWPVELLNN